MAPPTTNADGRRLLAQIRRVGPFLEGSLTLTTKRCGNPRCRCAQQGPLHETALLTWKENNQTRTLYIPRAWRAIVTGWVEEAQRLKRLMHELSAAQQQFFLDHRKKPPTP
jgi:uncharacterized protein DUF6788